MSDYFPFKPEPVAPQKRRWTRPLQRIESLLVHFSPSDRLALYLFSILLAASTLVILAEVNRSVTTTVPTQGGTLVEGAVGTPRFINPLLAISPVDQDLTTLMYSGLVRVTPEGDVMPDLAASYDINTEGTQYIFYIRQDAVFHDGTAVTAHDVAFTISLAQNGDVKSPRRADWDGVIVEVRDDHTIVFTLPQPYAPFLENAQLGILPKHLWEGISPSEFPFYALNTNPVGSGPFMLDSISVDSTDLPRSYRLIPFDRFTLGSPNLSNVTLRFYENNDALINAYNEERIQSMSGLSGTQLPQSISATGIPSTRIFGIFFNQNRAPLFANAEIRQALDESIDRTALIDKVLAGYGTVLTQPLPPSIASTSTPPERTLEERKETVTMLLEEDGWKLNESGFWAKEEQTLVVNIATADTPELQASAETVAEMWRSFGIEVNVQVYPLAEFSSTVLRPRNYDAVLFGEVVGRTFDLFAFWHSSQRTDPGLNLALYANTRADRLLASARAEQSRREREELYSAFAQIIAEDRPAVFLYAPEFIYVLPEYIQGTNFGTLTTASERFLGIHTWYTDTESVWSFFTN